MVYLFTRTTDASAGKRSRLQGSKSFLLQSMRAETII